MKTLLNLLLVIFVLLGNHLFAQEPICDCKEEIAHYFNTSQNLESYKDQIKGSKDQSYEAAFQSVLSSLNGKETRVDCYLKIARLSTHIKDEHARVHMNGYDYGKAGFNTLPETVTALKASNYYRQLPRTSADTDSLQRVLSTKKLHEVEGIYTYDALTIGIYKEPASEWYKAVVLTSKTPLWEVGMIQGYYRNYQGDRYQTVFAALSHSRWYHIVNNEFQDGRFFISRATKAGVPAHFDEISKDVPTFEYRYLDDKVDYIRLGSFSRMTSNWKESKAFVKSLEDTLNGEHLIIDLRNNTGGADKVSKPYWKLAKKYARKGRRVYVLVNNYTASNAEITAQIIKRNENVLLLGRNTNGACSYGSNYGNTSVSPSGIFFNTITDMDYSYLLPYEEVGLPVDITLDLEREWVTQVLEIINNNIGLVND